MLKVAAPVKKEKARTTKCLDRPIRQALREHCTPSLPNWSSNVSATPRGTTSDSEVPLLVLKLLCLGRRRVIITLS